MLRLQTYFFYFCHVFYVFNVFYFYLNVFLHLWYAVRVLSCRRYVSLVRGDILWMSDWEVYQKLQGKFRQRQYGNVGDGLCGCHHKRQPTVKIIGPEDQVISVSRVSSSRCKKNLRSERRIFTQTTRTASEQYDMSARNHRTNCPTRTTKVWSVISKRAHSSFYIQTSINVQARCVPSSRQPTLAHLLTFWPQGQRMPRAWRGLYFHRL